MTISNPSEYARLEDELEYYKAITKNPAMPKGAKEEALREVRKLEDALGIKGANYNGGSF